MSDKNIKVYKDNVDKDSGPIVGYKQLVYKDSGIIFSPYIPTIFSKTIQDEDAPYYMIDGITL